MPENAAAEGGFGLSAADAFGGQVGTGNVSASAVGGAQGGLGGPGEGPAAQSGIYGRGTPTPGTNVSNAQALADRAQDLANKAAANRAAAAAARGMRGKAASNLGIGSLAPNSNAAMAQQAVSDTVNALGTISQSAVDSIANDTGLPSSIVSSMADQAIANMNANTAAATKGSGLGVGSVESENPTVSTTTGMVSVDENGNIIGYGLDEDGNIVDVETLDTIDVTAPNVTEQMISDDLVSLTPTTTTQTQTTPTTAYSEKGLLGRIAQDLSMGLTNPFASRETQTESLLDRGYNQAEIDAYFDRTDATMARDAEAQSNAPGSRDEVIRQQQATDTVSDLQPVTTSAVSPDLLTSSEMLLNGIPLSQLGMGAPASGPSYNRYMVNPVDYLNAQYAQYGMASPYEQYVLSAPNQPQVVTQPRATVQRPYADFRNYRQLAYDELAAQNNPFRFIV